MGRAGILLLVLLGLGVFVYQRPELLQNVPWLAQKLGLAQTSAAVDTAGNTSATATGGPLPPRALRKCVGADGQVVYSNMGCAPGQQEGAVRLSHTSVVSLHGGAAAANATGSVPEPQTQSVGAHLRDKARLQ